VAPFLRGALWDVVPALLSSATLAAGKDFSYLAETLGLEPGEAVTYDAGTPFDYQSQMLLFTPEKGLPEPKSGQAGAAWRTYAQAVTLDLVTKSKGGALLLFTSRSALNESYKALAGMLQMQGLTVLKQDDAPTSSLIRQFKQDGNAVLFGLRTFFEGVDVQGSALRLVVLDKLPFAVPTDLVNRARCEALVRQYGKWADWDRLTVPQMILILTQGIGRLIRHRDDRGVVAILDPRLSSKSYGRRIIGALPPARRTTRPEEAMDFLAALS
jgi:ATP-dependent DNA helicase DinG